MTPWKQAVARAFDGAEGYDRHAGIQARAAKRLVESIAGEPLARHPHVLEIGCGTGLLSTELRARIPVGAMLVTDLAPRMVFRCRDRLGPQSGLRFAAMDGERPGLAPGFDLIVSNLAAQWFEDLPGSVARLAGLLAPGGLLALTTLLAGTFGEWEAAHADTGLTPATPPYPEAGALQGLHLEGFQMEVRTEILRERHPNGLAFLRALRAIGAATPSANAAAASAGALRPVLRAFEAGGGQVSYIVATCLVRPTQPSLE